MKQGFAEMADDNVQIQFGAQVSEAIAAIQKVADQAERVRARESRRSAILESLAELGVLTAALRAQVTGASTLTQLEVRTDDGSTRVVTAGDVVHLRPA